MALAAALGRGAPCRTASRDGTLIAAAVLAGCLAAVTAAGMAQARG